MIILLSPSSVAPCGELALEPVDLGLEVVGPLALIRRLASLLTFFLLLTLQLAVGESRRGLVDATAACAAATISCPPDAASAAAISSPSPTSAATTPAAALVPTVRTFGAIGGATPTAYPAGPIIGQAANVAIPWPRYSPTAALAAAA